MFNRFTNHIILFCCCFFTNLGRRFSFRFLNSNSINAYSELDFWYLRSFALFDLLVELQFANRIFDDFNTFGLINISAAQILKQSLELVTRFKL